MRLIVADTAGSGVLTDKEGAAHQLSGETWTETDLRDTITGPAWVRYRDDGRTVEVAAGETYNVEAPVNEDVIDVRTANAAADEIAAAIDGMGTDEDRIYRALETAPHDHSRGPWIEQLRFIFTEHTGRDLDAALDDELSGSELERARQLLH
ncbi:MAG: Annexin [Pseudonocardiales bacterium]|jgi:hypothetical protein|nr:Annexin [Pseudonocardiales bacterium]